jgi:hypothetical protein
MMAFAGILKRRKESGNGGEIKNWRTFEGKDQRCRWREWQNVICCEDVLRSLREENLFQLEPLYWKSHD